MVWVEHAMFYFSASYKIERIKSFGFLGGLTTLHDEAHVLVSNSLGTFSTTTPGQYYRESVVKGKE